MARQGVAPLRLVQVSGRSSRVSVAALSGVCPCRAQKSGKHIHEVKQLLKTHAAKGSQAVLVQWLTPVLQERGAHIKTENKFMSKP